MTYFDSAYLLKCYVDEAGSVEVRALAMERGSIACCSYGRMELHGALHRKLREGELSAEQFNTIARQIDLDDNEALWHWLPATAEMEHAVVCAFRNLPATVYLRTADAVHLCCAQANGFEEIYSNDRHLLAAASSFELTGRNVIRLS